MLMILYGLYLIAPEQKPEDAPSPRTKVPKERNIDPAEVRRLAPDDEKPLAKSGLSHPIAVAECFSPSPPSLSPTEALPLTPVVTPS